MGATLPEVFARPAHERRWSPTPGGRLLSNGRYRVLLTQSGTGVSAWNGHALTRWHADRTEDRCGSFVYLRDTRSGGFFSVGAEPAGAGASRASTTPGRVILERSHDELEVRLEVCVDPELDVELRRLTIVNRAACERSIEVTTCAEVVLNAAAADAAHPAFSKLFVQTEALPERSTLLARRRPRGSDESHPWFAHALLEGGLTGWETDRMAFVGRGGSFARPAALTGAAPLTGSVGNVLDPVLALRRTVTLAPGATATLTFAYGVAADRAAVLALMAHAGVRGRDAFALAETRERELLRACGLAPAAGEALQALAVAIGYGHPGLRAPAEQLERHADDPALLRGLGLDPRQPLVLAWLDHGDAGRSLAELASVRRYWREIGFECTVLALCADPGVLPDTPGVLVRAHGSLGVAQLDTLASLAHAVVSGPLAELAQAVLANERPDAPLPARRAPAAGSDAPPGEPLRCANEYGGFTADGREYVIRMAPGPDGRPVRPPLPWINVIANEQFGFLVSETGAGNTWCANSREHRLTPWSNDPLLDPHGEALYVRDEDTGAFGSPTAGPAPLPGAHEMRHGFGYSVARHASDGLRHDVLTFAHRDQPVRLTRWRVTNTGTRARRLSLVAYQRLVLGVLPGESGRFVVTEHDAPARVLLARNPAAGEFSARVAFAAAVAPPGGARHVGADRESFLGSGGSPESPRALAAGGALDGRCGAGLDPCFAEQLVLEVAPGATAECTFLLGECGSRAEALALVAALRVDGAVERALMAARGFWEELVSGVRIETPLPELDLMVNGWLAYQTLSCRMWGRTAFYQSGGAFGFRDQLQDAASLLALRPELTRTQILLHASHQFVEGDVLHWWHPPLSKGMRTRFADDLLWLPYLAATYVQVTGDWGVLDEPAPFLKGPLLGGDEDEAFIVPEPAGQSADVYEHCCRAIDRSLVTGAHGLPLFGTGDWNDGMNRVGREGRGESVWMGFFLHAVLGDFAALCERRGDGERAERYARFRDQLRGSLNEAGWDGEWYRRAYYDDGTPLGSRDGDECRIDGLAQAWAVISGAAPPARAAAALDAVERELVSERDGLIRLLTPPFENTPHDPGYIKGYVPGVRENGGQYTHAALWVVRAFAEQRRRERAAPLLAMLSPVRRAAAGEAVRCYRAEPYVVVADVYGEPPHVGRGGWSWYTGSAGWMLRVALESILGLRMHGGEALTLEPCVPDAWPGFELRWRIPGTATSYAIHARRDGPGSRIVRARLDGREVLPVNGVLRLGIARDGQVHELEIGLGGGG